MAENANKNQGPVNSPDKNLKPKFNSNWIFAILAVSFILINLFYGGKSKPKAQTRDLMEMIANRDIEKIIVVNKEVAEIYLKKEQWRKNGMGASESELYV
jgi:AFG3 family protein